MAELTIWTGTSSQVKNLGAFLLSVLIVPIPWALWRYISVKCEVYTLTTERLLVTSGVFNKKTETLELYRIRDLQVVQPLLLRFFGLQNILLLTSDSSTPQVILDYLPANLGLGDKLREHLENARMKKRVREVDIE